jgi:hypothetical protein
MKLTAFHGEPVISRCLWLLLEVAMAWDIGPTNFCVRSGATDSVASANHAPVVRTHKGLRGSF